MMEEEVLFFASADEFETWFAENHQSCEEQWVGFYKKESKIPSITWPESVKIAICFGWIDGLRKSIDNKSYKIRFTPRRKHSIWSNKNIAHVKQLTKEGLMRPPGVLAYEARKTEKSGIYSFEQKKAKEFLPPYIKAFKSSNAAWENFNAMPPHYKKLAVHWVMEAKKEETRIKRLTTLIECSKENLKIPSQRRY